MKILLLSLVLLSIQAFSQDNVSVQRLVNSHKVETRTNFFDELSEYASTSYKQSDLNDLKKKLYPIIEKEKIRDFYSIFLEGLSFRKNLDIHTLNSFIESHHDFKNNDWYLSFMIGHIKGTFTANAKRSSYQSFLKSFFAQIDRGFLERNIESIFNNFSANLSDPDNLRILIEEVKTIDSFKITSSSTIHGLLYKRIMNPPVSWELYQRQLKRQELQGRDNQRILRKLNKEDLMRLNKINFENFKDLLDIGFDLDHVWMTNVRRSLVKLQSKIKEIDDPDFHQLNENYMTIIDNHLPKLDFVITKLKNNLGIKNSPLTLCPWHLEKRKQ